MGGGHGERLQQTLNKGIEKKVHHDFNMTSIKKSEYNVTQKVSVKSGRISILFLLGEENM